MFLSVAWGDFFLRIQKSNEKETNEQQELCCKRQNPALKIYDSSVVLNGQPALSQPLVAKQQAWWFVVGGLTRLMSNCGPIKKQLCTQIHKHTDRWWRGVWWGWLLSQERTALFRGVCGTVRTGTHPGAAKPDGKGRRREKQRWGEGKLWFIAEGWLRDLFIH